MVENIERQRQPYPTLDAVYFLTPCRESVLRLVDDFTAHKTPMYKAAHIHFTSGNVNSILRRIVTLIQYLTIGLDDELFSELNRKFKAAGASEYIQSLKEMYVDFMGMYWLKWNKLWKFTFWL